MAKKGQAAQLQIEVNNDEEWDKLLQRDGLIVVDIFSEWCGPCLGMQANLKKIKLELGGDVLVLAVAKSDGITQLARFRNKSEPTWMFISKTKMVNLMFGADAPKLTRLITEELKKEQSAMKGEATDRAPLDVTEMADEERVRYDAAETVQRAIREKEESKRAKELLERRTKECENILNNVPNFGTVLIFPSAKDKYKEVLNEILDEAGLVIHQTEKLTLQEEVLRELCYFSNYEEEFPESCLEELLNEESCAVLFKFTQHAADQGEEIDDAIFGLMYGKMKRPPGDHECAAQLLVTVEEEAEDRPKEKIGVWVPMKPQLRATALKLFFPKMTKEFLIPEPEPEPDHVAIIFSINKKDEILPVVHQYQQEVMKRGFFTSENPDDAQLVAKTLKELDKLDASQRTFSEKIVMQVSKKRSEAILAFVVLDPIYMSPNPHEGKLECAKFFPEGYDEVEEEDVEEEEEEQEAEAGQEDGKEIEEDVVPNEVEPQAGEGDNAVEGDTTEEQTEEGSPEGDVSPTEADASETPPPPAPEETE